MDLKGAYPTWPRAARGLAAPAVMAVALVMAACGGGEKPTPVLPQDAPVAELPVFSESVKQGEPVPIEFTCDGADRPPHLRWGDPPADVKSFAIIADDPDAPRGVFTHWVVYDIPAGTRALPPDTPRTERLANGAAQGLNDGGTVGYRGPCPPKGDAHEYRFFVYALDVQLKLEQRAKVAAVLAAMRGHVLAVGHLSASYQRR